MRILLIIGLILIVLWMLGLVTSYSLSWSIHYLLVIGIIILIVWLVAGRR